MRPAKPDAAVQPDMLRETLEAILDPRHELLELGRRIDWARLDAVCGETFVDTVGRPGPPKQSMRWLRKQRTWLGRVIRDLARKIEGDPAREAACAQTLERARRIHGQRPGDADELYAFHAPRSNASPGARPAPDTSLA